MLFPVPTLRRGFAENLRFLLFGAKVIQKIVKQSCNDLLILAELAMLWLIIGCDNIFTISVNGGICIDVIVHNSLTQNRNRLKFWIYASYVGLFIQAVPIKC